MKTLLHLALVCAIVYGVLWLRSGIGQVHASRTAALHFELDHLPKALALRWPAEGYWTLQGYDTGYKNAILRQVQDMLSNAGIPREEQRWYVAQLVQENGALTADRISDHGCSFGVMQYNSCAKDGMSARRFLLRHPEWITLQKQLSWFVSDVKGRRFLPTIKQRIVFHNCKSCALAAVDACYVGGRRMPTCYFQRIAAVASTLSSL